MDGVNKINAAVANKGSALLLWRRRPRADRLPGLLGSLPPLKFLADRVTPVSQNLTRFPCREATRGLTAFNHWRQNTSDATSKIKIASDATFKGDDDRMVSGSQVRVEMTDVDEEGFKAVSVCKKRSVGIPVLVFPAKGDQDLRKVNPVVQISTFKTLLRQAPIRSKFTAQDTLLLDVATEKEVNVLLRSDQVGGTAIFAGHPLLRREHMQHKWCARVVYGGGPTGIPQASRCTAREKNTA